MIQKEVGSISLGLKGFQDMRKLFNPKPFAGFNRLELKHVLALDNLPVRVLSNDFTILKFQMIRPAYLQALS